VASSSSHTTGTSPSPSAKRSGHNWVEGQGSGARIDKKDGLEEDQFDAMGNKVDTKKAKKITSSEARKLKKDRMARKKRGEDVDDDF